jgi:hypothetical protein
MINRVLDRLTNHLLAEKPTDYSNSSPEGLENIIGENHMNKKIWIGVGLLLVLIIVLSFIFRQQYSREQSEINPQPTTIITTFPLSPEATLTSQVTRNIIVTSPKVNETVTLPIRITGKARVFENQFNYRVRDANKQIFLEGSAYANSPDTGQFGDFTISIASLPTMRANGIILEVFDYSAKDGTEQNTVTIPVVFDPAGSVPIRVFFGRKDTPAGEECTSVYPVEHHIVKTQSIAKAAVEELLKGPFISEKIMGITQVLMKE